VACSITWKLVECRIFDGVSIANKLRRHKNYIIGPIFLMLVTSGMPETIYGRPYVLMGRPLCFTTVIYYLFYSPGAWVRVGEVIGLEVGRCHTNAS